MASSSLKLVLTQRRRALQYHYRAADARWIAEAGRLAVYGQEGKDVTC